MLKSVWTRSHGNHARNHRRRTNKSLWRTERRNQGPDQNHGERALINIVEQGLLDAIVMGNVDRLALCTDYMGPVTQQVVRTVSFTMTIAMYVRKQVDRMVEDVRSKRTLEHQLVEQGVDCILALLSRATSAKIWASYIFTSTVVVIDWFQYGNREKTTKQRPQRELQKIITWHDSSLPKVARGAT